MRQKKSYLAIGEAYTAHACVCLCARVDVEIAFPTLSNLS